MCLGSCVIAKYRDQNLKNSDSENVKLLNICAIVTAISENSEVDATSIATVFATLPEILLKTARKNDIEKTICKKIVRRKSLEQTNSSPPD